MQNVKKSQSLSMNTIIVAALALLVLAIVSLLFIGRMNVAREDLNDCRNNGGYCVDRGQFGNCQLAADAPQYSRYSVGRELRSYRCFNAQGGVNDNEMCCAFT